ncbi:hypothetical protein FPSE_07894 [Fusarium pseudograminearum CS3096]|uniref:Peptidase C14 caspase domain-containing protein n=1 Tax=Fusarium pseudograminearum (strain CS3096) TaxID=1028729 RepID=K3UJ16_FUSPC|nr:hypothetical protein FPSE_07894 [Fusarium pseudograminearum CS3096]EKJ71891.1 hypothetical protein FPSE_07894 [Fusarium pseudograminearum CS3096]
MSNKAVNRKRALLIGSPLELSAVDNDLDSIQSVLELHRFSTTRCCREGENKYAATREGIFDAIDAFTKDTQKDDSVVLYYSGHGNIAERAHDLQHQGNATTLDRWRLQFIVPLDFMDNVNGNRFKGITDFELSNKLVTLSQKTSNITLILDCCHSTRMARAGAAVKSLNLDDYPWIAAHVRDTIDSGHFSEPLWSLGNPSVVRIAAAEATEPAWEDYIQSTPQDQKKRKSVLTEALVEALQHVASTNIRMSWDRVMLRVRDRVLATMPHQHPSISGPSNRFCFDTAEDQEQLGLPISKTPAGTFKLHGGHLHGVAKDDTYAIVPTEATTVDPAYQIAEATVIDVRERDAILHLTWSGAHSTLPNRGAHAILTRRTLPKSPVIVQGSNQFFQNLSEAIGRSSHLCVGYDFPTRLAFVRQDGDSIILEDDRQQVVRRTENPSVTEFIRILEGLSKGKKLLSLQGAPASSWPLCDVSVTFGLVNDNGDRFPFQGPGARIEEDQSVYFELVNNGNRKVYVSILDICLNHITVVNEDGNDIPAGQTLEIGETADGELKGLQVSWPDDVPRDRNQSIKMTAALIMTSYNIDLSHLETGSPSTFRSKGPGADLISMIDQILGGGDRPMSKVMAKVKKGSPGFGMWTLEYEMVPTNV